MVGAAATLAGDASVDDVVDGATVDDVELVDPSGPTVVLVVDVDVDVEVELEVDVDGAMVVLVVDVVGAMVVLVVLEVEVDVEVEVVVDVEVSGTNVVVVVAAAATVAVTRASESAPLVSAITYVNNARPASAGRTWTRPSTSSHARPLSVPLTDTTRNESNASGSWSFANKTDGSTIVSALCGADIASGSATGDRFPVTVIVAVATGAVVPATT